MADILFNYKEKCITPAIGVLTNSSSTSFTIFWGTSDIVSNAIYNIETSVDNGVTYNAVGSANASAGQFTFSTVLAPTKLLVRLAVTTVNCSILRSSVVEYNAPVATLCDIVNENSEQTITFAAGTHHIDPMTGWGIQDNEPLLVSFKIDQTTSSPVNFKAVTMFTATEGNLSVMYRIISFFPDDNSGEIIIKELPTTLSSSTTPEETFSYTFAKTGVLEFRTGPITSWTGSNQNKSLLYGLDTNIQGLDAGGVVSPCLQMMSSITLNIPANSADL